MLQQAEVREVLVGHERDRQVEDREFVLLDEVQQQVERPLERGQLDDEVRVEGALEPVAHATPPSAMSQRVVPSMSGPITSQPSGRAIPGSRTKNTAMNRKNA